MDIGAKGLQEVNLVMPQGTSLYFEVVHTDDDGQVINHSRSTIKCAMQNTGGEEQFDMSRFCTGTASKIIVSIPSSFTRTLPLQPMKWDLVATLPTGSATRLCYGNVQVVDTYALDGE